MKGRAPILAVLLWSAVALGACGGVHRATERELGPAGEAIRAPENRRCVYADPLEDVPSLERVLAGGSGSSLRLWGYGRDPADTMVLSIRYATDGFVDWVRVVGARAEDRAISELERLITSTIPGEGKPDWGVRLVLRGDGEPVTVLPAVVCPLRELSRLPTPAPRLTRAELVRLGRTRGVRIDVRVLVDERGRVADAEIVRSSGSRTLDDYALMAARDGIYEPRLHDGFPVPGILTRPIHLEWR